MHILILAFVLGPVRPQVPPPHHKPVIVTACIGNSVSAEYRARMAIIQAEKSRAKKQYGAK
jgi:hypothetical protein